MARKAVKKSITILTSFIFCALLIFGAVISLGSSVAGITADENILHAFAEEDTSNKDFVYLSDLPHVASQTKADRNKLFFNQVDGGGKITVKIEGAWYEFSKGIYAHGPSYVAYDIREYNYKYFTAYAGINKAADGSRTDGVLVYLQKSEDGKTWTNMMDKRLATYSADAISFQVDITGVKWLRVVADKNGHNAHDQAVWADAKLTNTLASDDGVESLDYYDAQIKEKVKAQGGTADLSDNALEKLILQRELVSRVGQYALKRIMSESDDNKIMLNWLLNDLDSLREFVLGGAPMGGSYYNSLTVLGKLYKNYKDDLNDATLLNNKWMPDRTHGELARTMMFSVALTHDHAIGSYLQASRVENQSEPLRRYAIFRYLYNTNRFVATSSYETMSLFGSLRVEEMRFIMSNIIDDESIIWLNDYVQTRINAAPKNASSLHTPHSYVRYTDPNYNNPVFYANENYDYFNALFAVDYREGNVGVKLENGKIGLWDAKYEVPGGVDVPVYTMTVSRSAEGEAKLQKVWMNFNNKFKTGSVCGGISKSGTNIRTARGIPAHVIGQPNHAAILYYSKNAQGKGSWSIDNNVGGWVAATKNERHLLGWGNATWQRTSPGGGGTVAYFPFAQDALNDYDNYVKAEEYTFLAKVYQGDLDKQEDLYEKALAAQGINLDAWYGLIQTYKATTTKTATDYYALAERVVNKLGAYALPMHAVLNLFQLYTNIPEVDAALKNPVFTSQLKTLETNALTKASGSGYSSATREKAKHILGATDTTIAEFSFDGANAGCIVWKDTYKGTGFTWKYSLDGKQTWNEVTFVGDEDAPIHQLTEDELERISADYDIYVYVVGANPDSAYKIEVVSKPALPTHLYANDWENRVIGVDSTYEWRYLKVTEDGYEATTGWISYSEASPDCSGEKSIEVRIKRSANKPASDSGVFSFTANIPEDVPERKYISVNYLSIEGYSTQSQDAKRPNYAVNAIDGNANTYWHTDYTKSLKGAVDAAGNPLPYAPAYLIIKLDVPRYISALEFSQTQYNLSYSIFAKTATVLVSTDGTTWTEAGKTENLEAIEGLRAVHFRDSLYAQYVKLELTQMHETNVNDGVFATVAMVNLYEDTTKTLSPDGEKMPDLSEITPTRGELFGGLGEVISEEEALEIGGEPTEDEDDDLNDYIPTIEKPAKNPNLALAIALPIVCVVLIGGGVAAFFILKRKGIIKGNKPAPEKKAAEKKSTVENDVEEKKPAAKKTAAEKKPAAKKDAGEKKPATKKKEN